MKGKRRMSLHLEMNVRWRILKEGLVHQRFAICFRWKLLVCEYASNLGLGGQVTCGYWRASKRPTAVRAVHQTVNEVREPKALTNAARSGRRSHQDEIKVDRTGGQSLCLWGRSK